MNSESVLSLFFRQVRESGDRTAVIAEDESVTYRELWARAAAVASYLSPRVVQGQVIGVFTTRSVDMLAAMLGIWQAGCAYLPLDANDPPERYLRILEIAECGIVLAHPELVTGLGGLGSKNGQRAEPDFIDLRGVYTLGTTESALPLQLAGDNLAYVMFTSGSSGAPKGVEVEHHSLVSFLCACRDLIGFTGADCFLAVTTIGFDVSIAELFVPLISGGTILLRGHDLLHSPQRLAAEIRKHGVTVFQAVATIWSLILAEHSHFPRLRVAMNMGEAISNELAARLLPLADQVWNMYGPTEATVYASACCISQKVLGDDFQKGMSAPIGRALSNATCLILDPEGRSVSDGERGELYIGGPAVARGYRNAPELTGRVFVELGPGIGRAYRTGDIAALRADGELLYFGRNDDQLKIRGLRVEPGEVRAALLLHPAVSQAAVTWFSKSNETRAVVAAVVTAPGHETDAETLREWLGTRLRPQMIPECLLFRLELPRLPNKKIDYKCIREDAIAANLVSPTAAVSREPTATELKLIAIWQSILHISPIGISDHFLSIGGDSLGAMHMLTRVEKEFGKSLSISNIFENLQLDQLAALIDGENGLSPQQNFVFPLHQMANQRPLFFNDADLRMASAGRWTIPCPLYGIAHWAQEAEFLRARSIADLARTHVVAIRQIQPFGPYRLGGQEFGGVVALEVARQLESQGEQVELLFLLDPRRPGTIDPEDKLPVSPAPPSVLQKLGNWLQRSRLCNWIIYQAHHIGRARNDNPVAASTLPRSHWPAFWGNERRLRTAYVARPCSAAVLAFFTEPGAAYDAWAQLLGQGGRCQLLPAGQDDIYSDACAAQWKSALEREIRAFADGVGEPDGAIATLPLRHPAVNALRPGGDKLPFFAIGSHPRYADAVQRLDSDRPVYRLDVYALQHDRLRRGLGPLSDIDQIGIELADALRAVQPRGPYYLGGGCEGAMAGYALACEMQRRGEEVAQLILWITAAPGYYRSDSAAVRILKQAKAVYWSMGRGDFTLRTLRRIIRHEYVEYAIFRAMEKYHTHTPFEGTIILARTADSLGDWDKDPTLGWGELATRGVDIHHLPGDHDTWLVDHTREFGEFLHTALEETGEVPGTIEACGKSHAVSGA